MRKYIIQEGNVFNRLTVIKELKPVPRKPRGVRRMFLCKCSCGKEVVRQIDNLLSKAVSSCGCYKSEMLSKRNFSHGFCETDLYRVWSCMKARCNNPTDRKYKNYGARGIKVCDKWEEDFLNFYNDMIPTYKKGLSLDRKNNDGDYEKDNCRWATAIEQARNKTTNRIFKIFDISMCKSQIIEVLNLRPTLIDDRIKRGWSEQDAVLGRGGNKESENYKKLISV